MEPLNRGGRIYIKDRYPLSGLLFCSHCGRRMGAHTKLRTYKGEDSKVRNIHMQSLHKVRPRRLEQRDLRPSFDSRECVLPWVLDKLKEVYLGPGRDALIGKLTTKLSGQTDPKGSDAERLQRRVDELDWQANRLITAIRKTDDGGLVQELAAVRDEVEAVKSELADIKRPASRKAPKTEAEHVANLLKKISQEPMTKDRAVLRRFSGDSSPRSNADGAEGPANHRIPCLRFEFRCAVPVCPQ